MHNLAATEFRVTSLGLLYQERRSYEQNQYAHVCRRHNYSDELFACDGADQGGFYDVIRLLRGGAKLPAGTYTIRQAQDDPNMFEIQNATGTHSALLEGRQSSKTTSGSPQITFNRYGTTEYLEGVVTSGNSVDLETGVAEKAAAKKGSPQSHTVPAK